MKTEFQGEPVAGGTYPAGIWKTFMESLLKYDPLPKKDGGDGTGKDLVPTPTPGAGTGTAPVPTVAPAPTAAPPATGDGGTGGTAPQQEAPQETTPPAQDTQPPAQDTTPPTDPGATGGGGQAAPAAGGATGTAG